MSQENQRLPMEKVFRDPIHDYVYVQDQVILDLINTKEFQRLRRIHQLGTTSFVFHGAEHTRFSHSLGCYEVARRIVESFARNYPSKTPSDGLWNNDERLVTLCAALLHDIGHGAYSHTFEHIFNTDHEKFTTRIITDPQTEVNQVLRRISPDFPTKVASVISHDYPNPQVVQLISSQIDADRMDYLLRDSYYTGTNYGNFDLTRILRVMRPYEHGIAFQMSGIHAVEDFIVSRFQMYVQVYFHSVSRSMEVILGHLLKLANQLYQSERANHRQRNFQPHYLMPFFDENFTLDDYLKLDDGVLNTYFLQWVDDKDPILSDLAHRFLDRVPLKSARITDQTRSLLPELKQLVAEAGFDSEYYTAENDSYDLPYDAYDPTSKKPRTQIELMQSDGSLVELSTVSDLVRAISGKVSRDERFFFPKEMLIDSNESLFTDTFEAFQAHIKNNIIS
ncbi:HD domain-containing protein [Pediococcus pentosaceus]|jgi:HD superfamily phosphohydrolase|nr:HD domain-containing protein [Pediococcus pentosaceus]MBF7109274.1 HD domain-containing protein [Pediococcus pentosaceus]MCI1488289.1 HD domain-containing protein [Pediococcus pentosaceus]MCQ9195826.1 HD domain-containing protein [Pediococcus pentosaceus]MCQ9316581.1 HD domain-containing protein [Pediococcus pentosaceus]MCQ9339071.1 HD domain-containing protein [Pediococcus pentosaceus]